MAASSEQAGQWFAARWHLDRLIESKPNDASLSVRRDRVLDQLGKTVKASADNSKAVEPKPNRDGPSLSATRGAALAQRGKWAEADAEFTKATQDAADVFPWFAHALLQLQQGDLTGYRLTCERMLARFEKTGDLTIALSAIDTCTLAPDAVADLDASSGCWASFAWTGGS